MKALMATLLVVFFIGSAITFSCAETMDHVIEKDTTVDNEVNINGGTVVKKGATLTIKEGSTVTFFSGIIEVYGAIILKGTAKNPIKIVGTKKKNNPIGEIRILNSKDKKSVVSYCNFIGMDTAISVANSAVLIENSTFTDNQIAIDAKQKDDTEIKNNTIKGGDKVGIFCKNDSRCVISNNKISGIKKFGVYIYRSKDVKATGNTISGCGDGIFVGYVGSDPLISKNTLALNDKAIVIEKGANPEIAYNDINGNEIGIEVSKRSDPKIKGNTITKNKKGIFITYSSYPAIENNNIFDNDYAIYLEFQSAQWEKELGDSMKRGGEKKAPDKSNGNAFASMEEEIPVAPKKNLSDKVSAAKNFWGTAVAKEIAEKGNSADISAIYDYYDAKEFTYEGKKYKLDSVDYSSSLSEEIKTK